MSLVHDDDDDDSNDDDTVTLSGVQKSVVVLVFVFVANGTVLEP